MHMHVDLRIKTAFKENTNVLIISAYSVTITIIQLAFTNAPGYRLDLI